MNGWEHKAPSFGGLEWRTSAVSGYGATEARNVRGGVPPHPPFTPTPSLGTFGPQPARSPVLGANTTPIDTFMVELFKEALHSSKACSTEAQRMEYNLQLRMMAPPRMKQGDTTGMIKKVAARLEVPFGYRPAKGTKKLVPYAFENAIDARDVWREAAIEAAKPKEDLRPGDIVLCRGQLATLSSLDLETDACTVTRTRTRTRTLT